MKGFEIKKDIYWVGVKDWNLVEFHGYSTPHGSTYNSYLIMDEKITLVDGVKHYMSKEQLARISSRVPARVEEERLDIYEHGESAYN